MRSHLCRTALHFGVLVFLCVGGVFGQGVFGQGADQLGQGAPAGEAPREIRGGETRARVTQEDLFAAAKGMDEYLKSIPQPNQAAWRLYYRWGDWGDMLVSEQMPSEEVLKSVTARFFGFQEGLDNPALVEMRKAMRGYLAQLYPPDPVGPNAPIVLRANQALIDGSLKKRSRTHEDHQETGNWIVGAWVTGMAHCHANITAKLATYQNEAAIEVRLNGVIQAPHNVASKGSFRIHAASESQINGLAYLYLKDQQFHSTEPVVTSNTTSNVRDVEGPFPFRGIARRQAEKKRPQGEAESNQIIVRQVTDEFRQGLQEEVAKANASLAKYQDFVSVLQRVDLVPKLDTTSVADNAASFHVRFPESGSDAPARTEPMAEDSVLEMCLHESVFEATTCKFLQGAWWSNAEFTILKDRFTGTSVEQIVNELIPERWGVQWDWRQPVTTRITPDYIEYVLSFSKARIKDEWVDGGLVVRGRFGAEAPKKGMGFRRIGDVEVSSLDPNGKLTEEQKEFFRARFSALSKGELFLDRFNLPIEASLKAFSMVVPSNFTLEEGWVRVNFKMQESFLTQLIPKLADENGG